ncbi:MAG: oxidoreductase, partial [Fibrobacteria bacterium]|nr:oxidoreductase [Fibrobacteria bacterium]
MAGGTGQVGEGIVRAFLRQGARVIVPVRSSQSEQKLREYVQGVASGELDCIPGIMGNWESACGFRD